jgi:hypothetical protein
MTVELRKAIYTLQIRKIKAGLLSRPLEDITEDTEVPDILFEI